MVKEFPDSDAAKTAAARIKALGWEVEELPLLDGERNGFSRLPTMEGNEERLPDDRLPDFAGKVVLVQLASNLGQWAFPEPVFEMQGGQLFLVGKPIPGEGLWTRQMTFCIPWRAIGYYLVFDSIEAYWSFKEVPGTNRLKNRRGWLRGAPG